MKLDEYLTKFKGICDNLATISKPFPEEDKVFRLAQGLGPRYANFRTAMLTKPPYPTLNQFILALQNNEQVNIIPKEKEDKYVLNHNQAFFNQQRSSKGTRRRGTFSGRNRGVSYGKGGRVLNKIIL